ncbi:phospholipase A and acyltransferase 3-like [Physella acuta]|uniref:phospholipase A and acyltransferase 3-like n=1 Tax=Physella acuta TaxID=109671 RepID=UPI0027DC522E|nr:phospholipase A and acyltransferase 3-like [Physella acuta]
MSYRKENKKLLAKLQPGDIVKFKRTLWYSHFAIYIGDEKVIHLVSDKVDLTDISALSQSSKKYAVSASGVPEDIAEVTEEDFFEVAADSKAELANWDQKSPYSAAEIVKRAEARIGPCKYSLETYNCEHFVNEIKYNKAVSKQVEEARKSMLYRMFHSDVQASLRSSKRTSTKRQDDYHLQFM